MSDQTRGLIPARSVGDCRWCRTDDTFTISDVLRLFSDRRADSLESPGDP